MGLLSDDHMQWLSDFTGISSLAPSPPADPAPPAAAALPDAPPPVASVPPPPDDGSGLLGKVEGAFHKAVASVTGNDAPPPSGPSQEPSIAGMSKDFELDLPSYTLKKWPLAGGKVTITGAVGGTLKGKATVLDSNDTSFDIDGAAVRWGSEWLGHHVASDIENANLFQNLKLDGLSIKTEEMTRLGLISIEIKLLGVDKTIDHDGLTVLPTFLEGDVKLSRAEVDLRGEVKVAGLQFGEIKLLANLEGKIGPDAKEIIKDWLEKQALQRGADGAKSVAEKVGEAALEGIAIDAIITGALILGGLAAIAGTIEAIIIADELEALGNGIALHAKSGCEGWLAGASGQSGGGDAWHSAGYKAGRTVFDKTFAAVKEQAKDASDLAITAKIAAYAQATWGAERADNIFSSVTYKQIPGEAREQIDRECRQAAWNTFLDNNKTVLTEGTAKQAWRVCFGDGTPMSGKNWDRYLSEHKYGKYL